MPIARKSPGILQTLTGLRSQWDPCALYRVITGRLPRPLRAHGVSIGIYELGNGDLGGFQHVHGVLTTRLMRVSGLHGDPSGFLLRSHRDYMKWSDFQYSSDNIRMEFEYQKVIVSFHPLG